jgi:hypothetical protein
MRSVSACDSPSLNGNPARPTAARGFSISKWTVLLKWLSDILSAITASPVDVHSHPRWLEEKSWFDSYQPSKAHDYADMLLYAEKRYSEVVESDRRIDAKAEWIFGIAFAAIGGCAAAIISSRVPLGWSMPTLFTLALSMYDAIKVRLPSAREAPASIRDAIANDENEEPAKAIHAANIHLATEGNVIISAWKSTELLAATRLLLTATALFLLPLLVQAQTGYSGDSAPQSTSGMRAGHISLDLDLTAERQQGRQSGQHPSGPAGRQVEPAIGQPDSLPAAAAKK